MDGTRLGSPLQLCFCLLTLTEHTLLAAFQPWLTLIVQLLSAVSLILLICLNGKKLFSANVQKLEI